MSRARIAITLLMLCFGIGSSFGQLTMTGNPGPVVTLGIAGLTDPKVGAYNKYLSDVIGSYWYPEVKGDMDRLALGVVQIRFVVHHDGTITGMTVLLGDDLEPLRDACEHAITAPAPFKPFDDALSRQDEESYQEWVTFTAEKDSEHRQGRIKQLKEAIPVLTKKLNDLVRYDAEARAAKVSPSHYDPDETRKAITKLRNQLDSDKWEIKFLEPPKDQPSLEDVLH
jgi:hypothetical protein